MYIIISKYSTPLTFIQSKHIIRFLPGSGRIDTAVWMHYMEANKTAGDEDPIYLTPLLGQDMTQGKFLSGV